jgi:predicted DNA-binding transcriptional regulator YafY
MMEVGQKPPVFIGGQMVYRPTARVLAVLELLQTHGQLSASEVSRRLEVDERTVRRYIQTLQEMGVPVEAEMGRHGGYSLRPGFKLPPMMFHDDEVLVLTLGLLLARQTGLSGVESAVESALAKIERVLPLQLREQLRALQEGMLLSDRERETTVSSETIAILSRATQQKRQVRLWYSEGEREFDPYAVISHQERWYTVGYCHLREAMRTFRLDRVEKVEVLPTGFKPPENFDALDYMLSSFEAIPDRWTIEVMLGLSLQEARRHVPRTLATLVEEGEGVRLRASMPDLDEMARILIAMGCTIKIIQPPELAAAFTRVAAASSEVARSYHEQWA